MEDDLRLTFDAWPFYGLAKAHGRYQDALASILSETEMDPTSWRIVMILKECDWISVSEIAALAHSKLSTMTKAIQRMEAAGLVELRARAQDRRATEVRLSPAGQNCVKPAVETARRIFDRAFAGFSPERLNLLTSMLEEVVGNLG